MRTKFIKGSKARVTLNKSTFKKGFFAKSGGQIAAKLRPEIAKQIKKAQREMVEEFKDHPVTQEIQAGNSSSNFSGILGGYGNLFSFIGFDEGSDPISPIKAILREKLDFSIKQISRSGKFVVTVDGPSKDEIEASAKQVNWLGGRSWIDGIEHGIAGLNRYLYDEDYGFANSLSGTGIQAKNQIRGVNYKAVTYVSKILNNFKKRISRLN